MQSLDSFKLRRAGKGYIVEVGGIRRDNEALVFHFDTGASVTLIGLNTICDDQSKAEQLRSIIVAHIQKMNIQEFDVSAKTVTNQEVSVYPCFIRDAFIAGCHIEQLYFCVYLGEISTPLLGFDFTDDCVYHHHMNGDVEVLAIASNVGKRCYPDQLLDFDRVLDEFYLITKEN